MYKKWHAQFTEKVEAAEKKKREVALSSRPSFSTFFTNIDSKKYFSAFLGYVVCSLRTCRKITDSNLGRDESLGNLTARGLRSVRTISFLRFVSNFYWFGSRIVDFRAFNRSNSLFLCQ